MLRKQFISNLAKMMPAALVAPQLLSAQSASAAEEVPVLVLGSHALASRFGAQTYRYAPATLLSLEATDHGFVLTDIFGKTLRSRKLVTEGKVLVDSSANRAELVCGGQRTMVQLQCSKAPHAALLHCAHAKRLDEESARRFAEAKGQRILLVS